MEELFEKSYSFEQVDDNLQSIKYDFVSVGEKDVPKRVVLTNYNLVGLENYYNLGFGNIYIDDDGNETISDMSRENNSGDKDKVLSTVFTCTIDFLSSHTNAIVTFYGNTSAKHRIYKMGLNKNYDLLSKFFTIKGGIISGIEIEENKEEGKRPIGKINPKDIIYENYDCTKCENYNFVTLELKEELKNNI